MATTQFPEGSECIVSNKEMEEIYRGLAVYLQLLVNQFSCVVMPLMYGGIYPFVHLTEMVYGAFETDHIHAVRYRNEIGGQLTMKRYPQADLVGKMVVIIDDIFDEGKTLKELVTRLEERGMEQHRTICIFNKLHNRKVKGFKPDYVGRDVPDLYVFGCGMDYRGSFRSLPYLMAVPEE